MDPKQTITNYHVYNHCMPKIKKFKQGKKAF